MTTREALYRLIDALPESEMPTAQRLLEYLQAGHDPVLQAFMTAPEDDEPETPEEAAEVREARRRAAKGHRVAQEDLARELGW